MPFIVTVRNKRVTGSKSYTVQVSDTSEIDTLAKAEAHILAAQPYVEIVKDAPAETPLPTA